MLCRKKMFESLEKKSAFQKQFKMLESRIKGQDSRITIDCKFLLVYPEQHSHSNTVTSTHLLNF